MSYIFNRSFPNTRLRRLRYNDNIRAMVQETSIEPKHLIAPVFVIEGKQQRQAVVSMPGVERFSVDLLIEYAKQLLSLGVTTIDLFPVISPSLKSLQAEHAYDENGLACTAIKAINNFFMVYRSSTISDCPNKCFIKCTHSPFRCIFTSSSLKQ
jgi:porphobilinogen synthase